MESGPPFPGSSSYLPDDVQFLRNGITGVPVLPHGRQHAYPAGAYFHRLCLRNQHADVAGHAGEILPCNGPYRPQHAIQGRPWSGKEPGDTSGHSAGGAAKAPCRLCSCTRRSSRWLFRRHNADDFRHSPCQGASAAHPCTGKSPSCPASASFVVEGFGTTFPARLFCVHKACTPHSIRTLPAHPKIILAPLTAKKANAGLTHNIKT